MIDRSLLVRAGDGAWERLEPCDALPDGGVSTLFGDDLSTVLSLTEPLVVVAAAPTLPTGTPDAICLTAAGDVALIALALGDEHAANATLPGLMAHAGSLADLSYPEFAALCTHATERSGTLPDHVRTYGDAGDLTDGDLAHTVGTALAEGRIQLLAVVSHASTNLRQSLRFLSRGSGARVGCWELQAFASSSVMALQAQAVDVASPASTSVSLPATAGGAHTQGETVQATTKGGKTKATRSDSRSSAASTSASSSADGAGTPATVDELLDATRAACDERTVKLTRQLHAFCTSRFPAVPITRVEDQLRMSAQADIAGDRVTVLQLRSDGTVELNFAAVGPVDSDWSVRAELVQGINRLLGADLGDVRTISQLNLQIREHLNDATLMDVFTEILGELLDRAAEHAAAAAA